MILIDTLRRDHLPMYGYEAADTAPFMGKLARESIVFERAFSVSSWTAPSTASIFTGMYPSRHGVLRGFLASKREIAQLERSGKAEITLNRIQDALTTLPELFSQRGYRTFGATSNVNIGDAVGFSDGFDVFHHLHREDAEVLTSVARDWVANTSDAPYFIYLHFNDVHAPYQPRSPWYLESGDGLQDELQKDLSAYDSEIRYLDEELASLYRDLGWSKNTLLLFVSDHGEEFLDHGRTRHGFSLYPELTRILLMLHAPRWLDGRVESLPVSGIDVLPTLASLLGWPPSSEWQGTAVVGPLSSGGSASAADPSRVLMLHREHPKKGVLWGAYWREYLYIEHPGEGRMLFHYLDDPNAATNIAAANQPIIAELATEVGQFRSSGRVGQPVAHELDVELLEQLQALGYVE